VSKEVKLAHARSEPADERLGALEVSEALLAAVRDDDDASVELGGMLQQVARGEHEAGETGGVIADARRAHDAVLLGERKLLGIGEDHVGVGTEDGDLVVVLRADATDDVADLVDVRVPSTGGAQPVADEATPPALVARGCRDPRERAKELEFLLVAAVRVGKRRSPRCLVHMGPPPKSWRSFAL